MGVGHECSSSSSSSSSSSRQTFVLILTLLDTRAEAVKKKKVMKFVTEGDHRQLDLTKHVSIPCLVRASRY